MRISIATPVKAKISVTVIMIVILLCMLVAALNVYSASSQKAIDDCEYAYRKAGGDINSGWSTYYLACVEHSKLH
jgi:hypothetical protein